MDKVNKLNALNSHNQHGCNNNQQNKQIKIGNYILGKTIGKGNSAVVKIATHSIIKQKVAVKMFDKSVLDSDKQLRLRREIESMKHLKHPNIVRIYEIMETAKIICIVTEIASNGELYDYIIHKKRLSEREARSIFKQIIAAVHHCHSNQIVHRDIKVENILLDYNGNVKLADFGFSNFYKEGELMDTWCGSPQYCAPELYLAQLYEGPNVDIWSLGVVLYVLVCGYLPFEAQVFNVLKAQIISGSYKIPFFLSEDCKSLIDGMLTLDPDKRLKMNDIINHKWLQSESDLNSGIDEPTSADLAENESNIFKEFRKMVILDNSDERRDEFEPEKAVLSEILKYGLEVQEIINSVRNKEFDSNAAIYYLLQSRISNTINTNSEHLRKMPRTLTNPLNRSIFECSNFEEMNKNFSRNNLSTGMKDIPMSDCDECINSDSSFTTTAENEGLKISPTTTTTTPLINMSHVNSVSINTELNTSLEVTNDDRHKLTDDEEDEKDDGMLIEQLGRDYLSRNNALRRHTIGTNVNDSGSSDIIKSVECFFIPNQTDESTSKPVHDTLITPIIANNTNSMMTHRKTAIPNLISTDIENCKKLRKTFVHQKNMNTATSTATNPIVNQPYKTLKSKNHRYVQQQRLPGNDSNLLQAPFANRRASDGGSNIVLFNQIYASKNFDESSFNSSRAPDINETTSLVSTKHLSRGSITSGIPIFPSSSQLSPSTTSSDSQNLNSSEDEETCSNNIMRYQRKNSRSRHEPYMDAVNGSVNLLNTTNTRARKSFSGSTSPPMYPNQIDLYSRKQTDPLELIYANKAHLEGIYNQSINGLPPNKELLMLQQENPAIDEQTQIRWQTQHRNSILSQYDCDSPTLSNLSKKSISSQHSNYSDTDSIDLSEQSPSSMDLTNIDPSLTTSGPKPINQCLHIIREEQNEMNMLSSSSSSISNTPKTTVPGQFCLPISAKGLVMNPHQFTSDMDRILAQIHEYSQNTNINLVNQYLSREPDQN